MIIVFRAIQISHTQVIQTSHNILQCTFLEKHIHPKEEKKCSNLLFAIALLTRNQSKNYISNITKKFTLQINVEKFK